MLNRRQHFRYTFTPRFYWRAALRAVDDAAAVAADIVNLSVGGICVRLDPGIAAPAERGLVSFALSSNGPPLHIPVERVHAHSEEPGLCGFRFLPQANAAEQGEQDRMISRFLLDEQRRDRRLNWAQQPG